MAAVLINRHNMSTAELCAAARSKTSRQARRTLEVALGLDGRDCAHAASACGMDRQNLRDWIHRYNEEGLAGLTDRAHPGRTPRLSAAQQAALAARGRRRRLARDGMTWFRRANLAGLAG